MDRDVLPWHDPTLEGSGRFLLGYSPLGLPREVRRHQLAWQASIVVLEV